MKQTFFLSVSETIDKTNLCLKERKSKEIEIKHFYIDADNAKQMKKDEGDYFTITFSENTLYKDYETPKLKGEIKKILKQFVKKYHKGGTILIIGLGNSSVSADAFGVNVTNQIIATNHYNDFLTVPKVALFNPEVTEKTGISSYKLIQMVVTDLNPDFIIVVDSLATHHSEYVNRTVEINDCGIIPGSALRDNKEITRKTVGRPVISIGGTFIFKSDEGLFTKVNTEEDMAVISKLVASSLNEIILS